MDLIPLELKATGAVGREARELGKDLKHACETRVLSISNASASAAFSGAWVHRISTTLQRGTAGLVYGVTQGKKAPMSAARMAKDQQMAEAALRDKDPGWYQAQNRGYSESTRTIRRVGSWNEALAARRARTRRGRSGLFAS